MYCKKCGAALPSTGFVCRSCGAMMEEEQIKMQKKFQEEKNKTKIEVNLLSDQYRREPVNRNFEKQKESKYLGAILIVLVVIILVILAILKVM